MNENLPVADGHLCNMGKMIEEIEGKLRNSVEQVNYQILFDSNDQLCLLGILDTFHLQFYRYILGKQERWCAH